MTNIQSVEFNTKEKAEKCLHTLGKRGIDIMVIHYQGKQISGYIVSYFIKKISTRLGCFSYALAVIRRGYFYAHILRATKCRFKPFGVLPLTRVHPRLENRF